MGNLVPDILSAAAEIAKIAIDAAANRLWAPVATLCYNVSMPAVFCLVPEVPTTKTVNGLHTEPVSLVSSIALLRLPWGLNRIIISQEYKICPPTLPFDSSS